jgi:hypothetical protein
MNFNKRKEATAIHHDVLALAAFLQKELGVVVTACQFLPAGRVVSKIKAKGLPCSLVSVEPFVPGGLRRLVLNAYHPLIQDMAKVFFHAKNCSGNSDKETVLAAVVAMGSTMMTTGSWPVPGLDAGVEASLSWAMSKSLLCGPHDAFVWPVPHERILLEHSINDDNDNLLEAIAVWPRRIYGYKLQMARDDIQEVEGCHMLHVKERWHLRDNALCYEWDDLQNTCGIKNNNDNNRSLSFVKNAGWHWFCNDFNTSNNSRSPENYTTQSANSSRKRDKEVGLLTYAPCFPLLAVAHVLRRYNPSISRTACLSSAAQILLENDRLFGFSCFFGVPLVDRTGILSSSQALKCVSCVQPPPSHAEVKAYQNRILNQSTKPGDEEEKKEENQFPVREALEISLLDRAEQIWQDSEQKQPALNVIVAWSGGIDSTAVLVALIRSIQSDENNNRRHQRLGILYSNESIRENPQFYRQFIEEAGIKVYKKETDEKLSTCATHRFRDSAIVVTGELGDQLFGSDRCARAFPDETASLPPDQLSADQAIALSQILQQQDKINAVFSAPGGLELPWEDTILSAMDTLQLLGPGGKRAWKQWIQPQLDQATIPIKTTFDFLWWVNFSMKWQNVMLRCTHDGGIPLLPATSPHRDTTTNLTGNICHLFNDRDLQCWSSVPQCHYSKFGDLSSWKTYKAPLKAFIHGFDGNLEYLESKTKVASLNFGFEWEDPIRYSDRMLGLVVNVTMNDNCDSSSSDQHQQPNNKISPPRIQTRPFMLQHGACSIRDPDGNHADLWESLVHTWVRSAVTSFPRDADVATIQINPWDNPPLLPSPFDESVAPYFASDDERQRRTMNPVTEVTLEGKCAAMFPPNIIKNATVLDLGACLGAACHYALCCGASKVVGVEVQVNSEG